MSGLLYAITLVLFFTGSGFSQNIDILEASAKDYFLSLFQKNNSDSALLNQLEEKLQSIESKINQKLLDSLITELDTYRNELIKISKDSALVLFNRWYLQLTSTIYNHLELKFFASGKDKIILFSTSMSCYCTLEMCKNQTAQILEFSDKEDLDYWIIDSYEHNELQIRYESLFSPSVLLFDGQNNLLTKIEYDEQLIDKLNAFNSQRKLQ